MTPVFAVASGTVTWTHAKRGGNCCDLELQHDDGWTSRYIHLNNDTPGSDDGQGYGITDGLVEGVWVPQGTLLGWVGDSGNAEHTISHLHFELYAPGRQSINAYPVLLAAMDALAIDDTTAPSEVKLAGGASTLRGLGVVATDDTAAAPAAR
jgi:murein DD-endopeptidase MepM/ murein hydrolase activator NlpD